MSGAPGENTRSCGSYPAPPAFEFVSPQVQNAANTIYEQKKAYDVVYGAQAPGKVYVFKSDFERMQYKMGLFRRGPCSGS